MPDRLLTVLSSLVLLTVFCRAETLPALPGGKSPQTLDEVWAGFDPQAEPLDIEIVKEWEEDGVVLRIVRYRIGIFKGEKAVMAAYYGFPRGGTKLPGLVQVHGGGQAAHVAPCLYGAKRGYAVISLNWRAERFHRFDDVPPEAQTDWGAVAGKQENAARGIEPGDRKFDPVPSGRNEGYFLRVMAARRALTFLERQPEVDGSRLGIYGHSMGGVITMETAAIDPRVKAAAPSCAPPLAAPDDDSLAARTADPRAYIEKLACPVLFMNPANDFHGKIQDMETIIDGMPSRNYRLVRVPHLNHRDKTPFLNAIPLWFDAHLKETFTFPETPKIELQLRSADGHPEVTVTPDSRREILAVNVYFTRQGDKTDYLASKSRFWHHARAARNGDSWQASLDLDGLDRPLWVYANVHYALAEPVSWHSYYYGGRDALRELAISSRLEQLASSELVAARVTATESPTTTIDTFAEGWENEWYTFGDEIWPWRTQKLCDRQYAGPPRGKLALDITSPEANRLVVAYGDYAAEIALAGGQRETVTLYPFDLRDTTTGVPLLEWTDVPWPALMIGPELKTKREDAAGKRIVLGGEWQGSLPTPHELRWSDVPEAEFDARRPFPLGNQEGKATLTLALADGVVGRCEPKQKYIQKPDLAPGFEVHAPGEVSYFLKGQFATLHATLVPHRLASVVFEVRGDGKQLYASDLLTGKDDPVTIEVPVTGVRELKIVVSDGDNGIGGDWGMWSDIWLAR